MATIASRRPGIAFETVAPSVTGGLPRTDIAGFAGFAAAGPPHLPIAIESAAQFRDLFGPDVELGRSANGAPVSGQLGPVVRAYFRAGGRRCWVVRIADGTAETSRFALPGLLAATRTGPASWTLASADAIARAPGSWADAVAVNLTLSERPVSRIPPDPAAPADPLAVAGATAGDLVRLSFRTLGEVILCFVTASAPRNPSAGSARRGTRGEIRPEQGAWFEALSPWDLVAGSLPSFPSATVAPLPAAGAGPSFPVAAWTLGEETIAIRLDGAPPAEVRPGTWVTLHGLNPLGTAAPLLLIDEVIDRPSAIGLGSGWEIVVRSAWRPLLPAEGIARAGSTVPEMKVLTAELWARDGSGLARMGGLGLTGTHARSLGRLGEDRVLLDAGDGTVPRFQTPFEEDQRRPRRFPLAVEPPAPGIERVFLPLGGSAFPRLAWYQPARHSVALPHLRDGLAAMEAGRFLDPGLDALHSPPDQLQSGAFQIQHPTQSASPPRRLQGIHALLPIEEVALVAVPDAAAPSWVVEPGSGLPLVGAATGLAIEPLVTGSSSGRLLWRQPGPVASIRVEASYDPRFARPLGSWVLPIPPEPERWTPPSGIAWQPPPLVALSWSESDDELTLELSTETPGLPATRRRLEVELEEWPVRAARCAGRLFWRVAAELGGVSSPWSDTAWATLPQESFGVCPDDQLPAPALVVTRSGGMLTLAWSMPPGVSADSFSLESAPDPAFGGSRLLHQGPGTTYSLWAGDDRTWYFRVAAEAGTSRSPWSATAFTGAARAADRLVTYPATAAPDSPLIAIHAALLVLAAARADLIALLSLPVAFRDEEAADYRTNLLSRLSSTYRIGLGDGDRTLTFGALYHPWAEIREPDGGDAARVMTVAPDGLMAGTIAARTLGGGAWLSAANQPLPGVVSLSWPTGPTEPADGLLVLNRLEQRPDGFTTLSEWTLDRRSDVAELSVRRLLILLRRLALREGTAFAFLPNDDALARLITREFEAILGELYHRGAFAGRVESEAFQVIADGRINTDRERETGRLLVERRVAPSKPLAFLTVRLLQLGGESLRTEES